MALQSSEGSNRQKPWSKTGHREDGEPSARPRRYRHRLAATSRSSSDPTLLSCNELKGSAKSTRPSPKKYPTHPFLAERSGHTLDNEPYRKWSAPREATHQSLSVGSL